MVLNPALYQTLVHYFGDVKISNEGVERVERYRGKDKEGHARFEVVERGEHYNVCCPVCGDDRFRLSISHTWLEERKPFSQGAVKATFSGGSVPKRLITHLAHCYNEDCEVTTEAFYGKYRETLEAIRLDPDLYGAAPSRKVSARTQSRAIPLPEGCVSLLDLEKDHPAIMFMARYNIPVEYIARCYGALFTDRFDPIAPMAHNRIIFPIYKDGTQIAWQGRTIDPEGSPRWFLPAGFVKCFYNGDAIPITEMPVINEGIINAIACGPTGTAIFGKQLNALQCEAFAEKWTGAIIATDPETYVPDNRKGGRGRIFAHELRDQLLKVISDVRLLSWPKEIIELAERHNNGEDVHVPDAAELGLKEMSRLIRNAKEGLRA